MVLSWQRRLQLVCVNALMCFGLLAAAPAAEAASARNCDTLCVDSCPSDLEGFCEQQGCTANGPTCFASNCDITFGNVVVCNPIQP